MGKIKMGAIVVDIRGKIGGSVFSKNRSGNYIRNKVTPVNAQTQAQMQQRSQLAYLSTEWRNLTQAQRDAWNAAAPNFPKTNVFGDPVTPTGKNLFTLLNANLFNTNGSQINVPPIPAEVTTVPISSFTAEAGPTGVVITFSDTLSESGILVKATPPLSPGVNFIKNKVRTIFSGSTITTAATDVSGGYTFKYGDLEVGQKVGIQVIFVNNTTGQASPPVYRTAIVTAA